MGTFSQNQTPETPAEASPFCLNEFARLIAVRIESGPEIRAELLQTGKDLSHAEQDRRSNRDAIWDNEIATRFNDARVPGFLDLAGKVSDVDATAAPLARRAGDKLLDVLNKIKRFLQRHILTGLSPAKTTSTPFETLCPLTPREKEPFSGRKESNDTFYVPKMRNPSRRSSNLLEFTKKTAPDGVAL